MAHYVLTHVNLIDGTKNCSLIKDTNIEVENNKIVAIGKDISLENKKVYNYENKYVIPGLINMHAHLAGSGKSSANPKDQKKLVELLEKHKFLYFIGVLVGKLNAKAAFYNGVTTVRAVGGIGNFDTMLRDKINKGKIVGPRLYVADYAIAPNKGHMVGTVSKVFNNLDDIKVMVKDLAEHNVDLIKVMITGGVLDAESKGHPGSLKMKEDEVRTVVDEAHKYNLKVAAHVESPEGVALAIKCHVDSIEHGADISKDGIKELKKYNGAFVATLSPAIPTACLSLEETHSTDMSKFNTQVVAQGVISSALTCIKNDILLGLGTDAGCPMTIHRDYYRELEYAHLYLGLTREQALYHGTLVNAQILGKEKEIGSIEVGKLADMVVVDNNPLDTFNNLNNPFRVIKDGKIYVPKKSKENLELETLLDKCYKANISTFEIK